MARFMVLIFLLCAISLSCRHANDSYASVLTRNRLKLLEQTFIDFPSKNLAVDLTNYLKETRKISTVILDPAYDKMLFFDGWGNEFQCTYNDESVVIWSIGPNRKDEHYQGDDISVKVAKEKMGCW